MERKNCWEFKKCGREPGGARADELGVCPVAMKTGYYGLDGEIEVGRLCWYVKPLFFNEGSRSDCEKCRFHKLVMKEDVRESVASMCDCICR